jgi:hypothetical protein
VAERAATVRKKVREWLTRVGEFTGREVVDDSALLDEVDETLSSDENIEILAARFGYPLPIEMGAKAGEFALEYEAKSLREALDACEARKPGERRSGVPESCKIVGTPAGVRKYCVVEDRRAGRFVKRNRG